MVCLEHVLYKLKMGDNLTMREHLAWIHNLMPLVVLPFAAAFLLFPVLCITLFSLFLTEYLTVAVGPLLGLPLAFSIFWLFKAHPLMAPLLVFLPVGVLMLFEP